MEEKCFCHLKLPDGTVVAVKDKEARRLLQELVDSASSANSPNSIVKRDGNNNFEVSNASFNGLGQFSATPKAYVDNVASKKLDKDSSVTELPKVYVKDASGNQTLIDLTNNIKGSAVVRRGDTGNIGVPNPTDPTHAINKEYADNKYVKNTANQGTVVYVSNQGINNTQFYAPDANPYYIVQRGIDGTILLPEPDKVTITNKNRAISLEEADSKYVTKDNNATAGVYKHQITLNAELGENYGTVEIKFNIYNTSSIPFTISTLTPEKLVALLSSKVGETIQGPKGFYSIGSISLSEINSSVVNFRLINTNYTGDSPVEIIDSYYICNDVTESHNITDTVTPISNFN